MSNVILLVDDDPHLLRSLARSLRHEPYTIYTARSADESVEILKAHAVHLIVSDEHMPGMTGTKFLTWVADTFPDVRRIMLTGAASERVEQLAVLQAGVYRFFTKPCNVGELANAIRQALEGAARI